MRWVLIYVNISVHLSWDPKVNKKLECCLTSFFNLTLTLTLLSSTEPEHLPKPPEASVWNGAASIWSLHYRHWSCSLFQVRNVRTSKPSSCFIYSSNCMSVPRSALKISNFECMLVMVSFSSFRKRTMFQKIVESVEGIADEKEKVNYVSNNATRKEIIMCVHRRLCEMCTSCYSFCLSLICVYASFLNTCKNLQGNDDDSLWPVCHYKAMGGAEQGVCSLLHTYSMVRKYHIIVIFYNISFFLWHTRLLWWWQLNFGNRETWRGQFLTNSQL